MTKTECCIKILELLKSVDFISGTQIANILNINKRNVIEYIKGLENSGFTIESSVGVKGGYHLVKDVKKDIVIPDNEVTQIINMAITSYTKLEVVYIAFNDKDVTATIHPYSFYEGENSLFIYCYNESKDDFDYISVEEIIDINLSLEHFTKKKR